MWIKKQLLEPTWNKNRDEDIDKGLVGIAEEGGGGMNWEHSIETYTLPVCKIDSYREVAVQHRELNLVFCDNLEGWAEKAMAPHSSTLAWKIPWTEEPGRLQSMGSLRVGHDWVTSLSLFTFMHWRRKWQPTPVFLPGESHRRWAAVYGVAQSRTQLKQLSSSSRGMGWEWGGKDIQDRGDIYILMADSCCAAETNTTLWSNYPPIENKF